MDVKEILPGSLVYGETGDTVTGPGIIGICTLMDVLNPGLSIDPEVLDRTDEPVLEWLQFHDVYHYSRPRESFTLFEAVGEAVAAGKTYVLVEDLS